MVSRLIHRVLLPLAQVDGTATAISSAISWNTKANYTLPSGGTWVYIALSGGKYESGDAIVTYSDYHKIGIASGGTTITGYKGTITSHIGIAFRKS